MTRLPHLFMVSLLATAVSLVIATFAQAGFGHRHRLATSCAECEPGCAADPGFGFEPGCGAETVCPTNPCIRYRHKHAHRHRHARGCCPEPTFETVLNPVSPETCRAVAVPVCLPACCQGCPCETSRCTLFGCGQVRYDYACGVSVIVRFKKCGDICVTYVGC